MYKDIVMFIEKCGLCKAGKIRKVIVPVQDMPIPNYPFECCSIDVLCPYTEANCGSKYVISVICTMTGWSESYCIKDKSSEMVTKLLLEESIPRHGCPRVLLSDNGG